MLMNETYTKCHITKETNYTELTPNTKLKTRKYPILAPTVLMSVFVLFISLFNGHPLLSGYYPFPRGWPFNRDSTVLGTNFQVTATIPEKDWRNVRRSVYNRNYIVHSVIH